MSVPKKIIFWSFIILGFFVLFHSPTIFSANSDNHQEQINFDSQEIKIAGQIFKVELAISDKQQQRGLSYREQLPANAGMLFVFKQPTKPGFWLKEMKFPLDIIWLDENRNVVYLHKNLSPQTYPKIFQSPLPVKYVLEIDAGQADKLKIKIGSHLSFKHFGFWWF